MPTTIFIVDGDICRDVDATDGTYPMVRDGRMDFYVFKDSEAAGEVVKERWAEMAANDRKQFVAMIGEERLVSWALGESDEYGIRSLDDFLEKVAAVPEEDLASYDSQERDAKVNLTLAESLGLDEDDSAGVDYEMLRKDLESYDLDADAFPEDMQAYVTAYVDGPPDDQVLTFNLIKAKIEAGDAEDIARDYTFQDVVAYRHN